MALEEAGQAAHPTPQALLGQPGAPLVQEQLGLGLVSPASRREAPASIAATTRSPRSADRAEGIRLSSWESCASNHIRDRFKNPDDPNRSDVALDLLDGAETRCVGLDDPLLCLGFHMGEDIEGKEDAQPKQAAGE